MTDTVLKKFDMTGKTAIVTGRWFARQAVQPDLAQAGAVWFG